MLEPMEVVINEEDLLDLNVALFSEVSPYFNQYNKGLNYSDSFGKSPKGLGYSNITDLEVEHTKSINELVSKLYGVLSPVVLRGDKVVRNISKEDIQLGDELVWVVANLTGGYLLINVSNTESKYDSIHFKDDHVVKGDRSLQQTIEVVEDKLVYNYIFKEFIDYPHIELLMREMKLNYMLEKSRRLVNSLN